ncbi:F-box/kelch-repeat protein At3g06240-like [Apium graveolens]|uniref:F-box/kelch-repeat protein At3g06240-like n=1 Tax=Apium graveolens TaxID=4045 RepID=UPI003D7AF1C1
MKKQSCVTSAETISDCEDLLTEILIKLPVESLLRCKSVSKPWLSLISNPNFVKSHINRTAGTDKTLLVHESESASTISLVNIDSRELPVPLRFPFSTGDIILETTFDIIGSYNGVVCVSVNYRPDHRYSFVNNKTSVYLWNPATKHSELVRECYLGLVIEPRADLGFGFDPLCNDYKVVWAERDPYEIKGGFSVLVYSLNRNAWRRVDPCPTGYFYGYSEICVNGLLCRIGSVCKLSMALDLNKEVFNCGVQLPVECTAIYDTRITVLNDSITVITNDYERNGRIYKWWMLDDEACLRGAGGEASWTLGLTIDVGSSFWHFCDRYNCGDILQTRDGGFLFYDSDRKEVRNVSVSLYTHHRIIRYNESLVSITRPKKSIGMLMKMIVRKVSPFLVSWWCFMLTLSVIVFAFAFTLN